MYYLYESHKGEFYTSNYELSKDELYCFCCMDSDELIGKFKTEKQLIKLAKDKFNKDYISPIIKEWRKIKPWTNVNAKN